MQKFQNLIEQLFEVKFTEISKQQNLQELELWDSLNHMLLITNIEKDFNITLNAEEIISMTSIETIEAILAIKLDEY